MKTVERLIVLTIVIMLAAVTFVPLAQAETGFSNMSSAGFRLVNGGMSSLGGAVASADNNLLATNMYPYQQDLSFTDYEPIFVNAVTDLGAGKSFRDGLVLFQDPPLLPSDTGLGKLLKYPNENYETVPGLLDGLAAAEARLLNARDIFAYGASIGYPGALLNLKTAIKTLAGIYLLIADEFLIDALEFRFSWSAASQSLEDKLLEQICLLGIGKNQEPGCQIVTNAAKQGAQYYYGKAVDTFVYGFGSAAMGKNIHISDYFDDSLFSLFNLSVERLTATLREKAAKQLIRGMSPDVNITANARKASTELVKSAYTSAYILSAAIAGKGNANFANNGGESLANALNALKSLSSNLREGVNPLGYDDRFIPMQSFDKFVLDTQGPITLAMDNEDKLALNKREFDANISKLRDAINAIYMSENTGGYKAQLATLTGVSMIDADFLSKVLAAGDDLYDCPIDSTSFTTCMQASGRTKGVLGSKYSQIREAQLNTDRALLKKQNLLNLISLEQNKHNALIEIENKYNTSLRDSLTHYLDKMKNARMVQRTVTKEKGKSKEDRTTTTYTIDYPELKWNTNKEIETQQALTDYRIAQFNANDEVTFKNYLNQLAEMEIEIGSAIQIKNSAVDDFNNALKEKNNYAYLYKKAVDNVNELNTADINKIKEDIARLRVMQSQDAIDMSRNMNSAIHSTYLAAKALEYWYMMPLKNLPLYNGTQYLNITDLYKVQTVADLKGFITKLKAYDSCPWGSVQPLQIQISLARDILGIKDTDPQRDAKLQAFLNSKIKSSDNSFRFTFSTSLNDSYISKWGLYNLKIWQGTLPLPCDQSVSTKGIQAYFDTRQAATSSILPRITLSQKGHSTFLKYDMSSSKTEIVEYVPVSAYLNLQREHNDPQDTTVTLGRFNALVNTDPNTIPSWSNSFKGRSVASSDWEMIIEDLGNSPIVWNKLKDIILYLDTIGSPLPVF